MKDLKHKIAARQSLAPATRTASATGSTVDRLGFESLTWVIHVGDWTDGSHAVGFEDSDDDSTFAAVAAADLLGTAPTIEDDGSSPSDTPNYENENLTVGYIGGKRYVRAKVTVTGSPATGAFIGVDAILGHPHSMPTT